MESTSWWWLMQMRRRQTRQNVATGFIGLFPKLKEDIWEMASTGWTRKAEFSKVELREIKIRYSSLISEYNPPTPAKGSGKHRYQFLLFAQRYPYSELSTEGERYSSYSPTISKISSDVDLTQKHGQKTTNWNSSHPLFSRLNTSSAMLKILFALKTARTMAFSGEQQI